VGNKTFLNKSIDQCIKGFFLIIPLEIEDILPMNNLKLRNAVVAALTVALAAGAVHAQSKPVKKTPAAAGATTAAPSGKKPTQGKPTVAQDKPTPSPSATSTPETGTPAAAGNIIEVAAGAPEFSTLVSAIKAAGLVEALSGKGPFTVFAPTDEAFAKIPKATLTKLANPTNKAELQKVLKLHVVAGSVMAADIKTGKVGALNIVANKGKVKVNGANVVKADIKASNGVIHAIDTVLIPTGLKLK
jgi:uncharacterized surface protein with fasciclin (FAS1) repeats